MSQKSATKKRPAPRKEKKPGKLVPLGEAAEIPEELSATEEMLEKVRPHLTTIGLVVLAVFLGLVSFAFWRSAEFNNKAVTWRDLHQASATMMQTGDVKELTRVADSYPDTRAGLYSALMAGDSQLRQGIQQLQTDREAGFGMIRKAQDNFQFVLDASDQVLTTLLQQRAQFGLAYATESLGEFNKAKTLYNELIEAAPNADLAEQAQRGLQRCSDPAVAEYYTAFKDYEQKTLGDAPGPIVPDRPTLGNFPEVELEPGQLPPAGEGGQDTPENKPAGEGDTPTEPAANDNTPAANQGEGGGETQQPPAADPPATEGSGESTNTEGGNSNEENSGEGN